MRFMANDPQLKGKVYAKKKNLVCFDSVSFCLVWLTFMCLTFMCLTFCC